MVTLKSISTMRVLILTFAFCCFFGAAASKGFAAQVTLAWNANTENDLAGYRIHHGTTSGSYSVHIDVQNSTSHTVTGLVVGQTYYFAATAYDAAGNESGYSNEVRYTVPNSAPSNSNPAPWLLLVLQE